MDPDLISDFELANGGQFDRQASPPSRRKFRVVAPPLDTERLADYAREAGLDFIALFGSHSRGLARDDSDIDLALMPASLDLDPEEVEVGLIRALGRGDLDLVWLPHANWLLAWQVAQHGRVLFERQAGQFNRFWHHAASRRADSKIWDRRNRDFVRRVLERHNDVDQQLVRGKLVHMARFLAELEQFIDVTESEFIADVKTYRAAERQTELLVECAAEINTEVARAVANIPATDYYSSFFSLSSAGWLSRETAMRLAEIAGLRNRLVHQYEEIQLPRLYRVLKASLPDWREYLDSVQTRLS